LRGAGLCCLIGHAVGSVVNARSYYGESRA
jgi:hypothetical protein